MCSSCSLLLILCVAVRDTCVKLVYQLYLLSDITGRASGGLRALSGRQAGPGRDLFSACSLKPIHSLSPSQNGALWRLRYLVLRRPVWHWLDLGLIWKGSSCLAPLPPIPPSPKPPPPVGEQKGAECDRQTAPQQPTHTKLILTRNLR